MNKPTIENTHALHQAGDTVDTYFNRALSTLGIAALDSAKIRGNQHLIAELVRSQVLDFNNTSSVAASYEIAEALQGMAITFGELVSAIEAHNENMYALTKAQQNSSPH